MNMKKLLLTSGLVMAMALPAAAQNRDSDGDVISVIDFTPLVLPKNIFYIILSTHPTFQYEFNTTTMIDGGLAPPQEVSISGTTYQVERSGGEIYLLPDAARSDFAPLWCRHPATA